METQVLKGSCDQVLWGFRGHGVPFNWGKEEMLGFTLFLGSLTPTPHSQLQVSLGSGWASRPSSPERRQDLLPWDVRTPSPPGLSLAVAGCRRAAGKRGENRDDRQTAPLPWHRRSRRAASTWLCGTHLHTHQRVSHSARASEVTVICLFLLKSSKEAGF